MEAVKLAFADGAEHVGDIRAMNVAPEELLGESYAASRRALIAGSAQAPMPGSPPKGGTVYFAAADGDGGMVSMIQSNYLGFGSGLCVPGYGITLHNRGSNFTLKPSHANVYAPGKRPYHTIIPGFMTQDGAAVGPFGVMGGFMQPQGHVQVIMNTVDFRMNPQAALDAPRFCWTQGLEVNVEGYDAAVLDRLRSKGHELTRYPLGQGGFGRGQIIWRTEHGTLCGGTEPRSDGSIYSY
jgi:gamma-glutamyltranspeptidase/glutathione hydrolase